MTEPVCLKCSKVMDCTKSEHLVAYRDSGGFHKLLHGDVFICLECQGTVVIFTGSPLMRQSPAFERCVEVAKVEGTVIHT